MLAFLNGRKRKMAAPKRRCRDPLGPRANEARYAAPSQHAKYYLEGGGALRERTGQECLAAHLNAKAAAAASHAPLYSLEPTASVAADMNTWGEGMAESRRCAIRYLFEAALGAPSEDEWDGPTGAIKEICDRLSIPKGSRPLVKKVLKDILKAQKDGYYYNAAAPNHEAGRYARIQDDTTEAKLVCDALGAGISVGKTTALLNAALLTAGREPVSFSAVQRFKRESPYLRSHRRGTRKSGSMDENSLWCRASLAQCEQLLERFSLNDNRRPTASIYRFFGREPLPPLSLKGIAYWDEKHQKIRLGHAGKYEVLVCRDPETGLPCSEQEGGVWDEEHPTMTAKFPGECRLLCGVAAVDRVVRGNRMIGTVVEEEGRRGQIFEYTGKWVLGPKAFNKKVDEELARARTKSGGIWKRAGGRWIGDKWHGKGYEGLYGRNARARAIEQVNKGAEGDKPYICVTVLMDHVCT